MDEEYRSEVFPVKVSVIIPVLNEKDISRAVESVSSAAGDELVEIVVVDGSREPCNPEYARSKGLVMISSAPGRARQMNAGAEAASGEVLVFLHSDTRLPQGAFSEIEEAISKLGRLAGAFRLSIDSKNVFLRFIALSANLRSLIFRTPFGDQAQFFERGYFRKTGGFSNIPLMEDLEIMQRIKRKGEKITLIRSSVKTSARRWYKEGIVYTTLRNRLIRTLFWLGVPAEKLAKYYRQTPDNRLEPRAKTEVTEV